MFEDIMKKSLEHYGQFVFGKWNTRIEPVQLPTFQIDETVLHVDPQGNQYLVTIETIDYHDSLTYRIKYYNDYAWVTPLELQKVQY